MARTVSIAALALMAGGFVGLVLTYSLFSPNPAVIGVQAAATALMLWARLAFGIRSFHAPANPTAGELVTRGPYAFVRNPIYTAACAFAIAGGAAHPSWTTLGFVLLVVTGALVRIFAEERALRARYPEYADYARRTKRLVPYLF